MSAPPLPLELIMIHEPWLASGSLPPLRGKVRMGGNERRGIPPTFVLILEPLQFVIEEIMFM